MFKKLSILFLTVGMSACTYNVTNSMAHTQGEASDVVDEMTSTTSTPKVDINANVPVNSPSSNQSVTPPPVKSDAVKK